jgi:predicted pyridoxine 5'-phosphate oxidase superfamily flavin-nucleotide-binding protein
MEQEPFHDGEVRAQELAGEEKIAQRNSGAIQSRMLRGAFPFIRQQPMVIVASLDSVGNPWCSIVFAKPGFLQPSEDATQLTMSVQESDRSDFDPLWANVLGERSAGALLIDLPSRRRMKINGHCTLTPNEMTIDVTESFPLCPKYIQRRSLRVDDEVISTESASLRGMALGEQQMGTVHRSDMFFVASTHKTRGPDASHRGGRPGFVKATNDVTLRIPDYPGNSMFNTFGNLLLDPRAGLVFPDFHRRRLLQLTGTAEIVWDQAGTESETGGSRRFWHFHCEQWIEHSMLQAVSSELLEFSPFNPPLAE